MYTPHLLQQLRDYLQAAVQMFNLSYGLRRVNAVYTRQKVTVHPKKMTSCFFFDVF